TGEPPRRVDELRGSGQSPNVCVRLGPAVARGGAEMSHEADAPFGSGDRGCAIRARRRAPGAAVLRPSPVRGWPGSDAAGAAGPASTGSSRLRAGTPGTRLGHAASPPTTAQG